MKKIRAGIGCLILTLYKHLKISDNTLFATFHILDRYLFDVESIEKTEIEPLIYSCLILASKHYQSIEIEIQDVMQISPSLNIDRLIEMEKDIFTFCGYSIDFPNEIEILKSILTEEQCEYYHVVFFLMSSCKADFTCSQFQSNLLVSCCLNIVCNIHKIAFTDPFSIPKRVIGYAKTRIKKALARMNGKNKLVKQIIKSVKDAPFVNCSNYLVKHCVKTKQPININNLTIYNTIGSGTYCYVEKVVYQDRCYAMKSFNFSSKDSISYDAVTELTILNSLSHPNILSISYYTDRLNKILLPLATSDLKSYSYRLQDKMLRDLALQLFSGLDYLHSRGCIHADIKPSNILVFEGEYENRYCYADFGVSKGPNVNYCETLDGNITTLWYRAPELLSVSRFYNSAIDVWSLCCVLYECNTRNVLFNVSNPTSQLKLIADMKQFNVTPLYQNILKDGLVVNPSQRATATTIYNKIQNNLY